MTCPRCSVAEISPLTNRCELCGYSPAGAVTVEAPGDEATDLTARRELAGEFQIDALLALGATRALYLAREQGSTHHVFLTALRRPAPPPPHGDDQFRRAGELAATLEHPHILPVLRFGVTESLYWYTMEHVRGLSLRMTIAARGPLDVRSTLRIVAQVASALDYGHRRGVVHGDLRPETVLIDPDGWVRVSDVLVSRMGAPAPERPAGAAAYVAPEDLRGGQRTPTADQYALAVIVHECLTGAPPLEGEALPAPRPDLPVHVVHAVDRARSAHPADRFPTVLDFVGALESPGRLSLADARPTGKSAAVVLSIPDWEPPAVRRRWGFLGWVLGAALAIAVGVVAWPYLTGLRRQPYDAGPPPRRAAAPPSRDTVTPAPAAATPPDAAPLVRLRDTPTPARPRPSRPTDRSARTTTGTTGRQPPPRTVAPAPAPSAPPATTAAEPGRLFVNATPWGALFIDGQPVGNTPKANLSVTPGTHTIRVEREGFETVERPVQVGPGQTVRITDIVLVERRP